MAHTPGPWKYEWRDGAQHIDSPDMQLSICDERYYPWVNAATADWHLIAAAPELLAACKLALAAFEHNHAIDWSVLQAAIAKAEGKQ